MHDAARLNEAALARRDWRRERSAAVSGFGRDGGAHAAGGLGLVLALAARGVGDGVGFLEPALGFLALAEAGCGRSTACSREAGWGQGGASGMACQECCGIGWHSNGALVIGCVPRMRRVHVVVLPALRGSQACFRPTDDRVELRPQVEHHRVSSESQIGWSGEWRMFLNWSLAARAAHLTTADPGQDRLAMAFHDDEEQRQVVQRQLTAPFVSEWPPSCRDRARTGLLAFVLLAALRAALTAAFSFLCLD